MGEIDIDDIPGLETEVWNALVAGDTEADARLLSDDFLGVYSSGFAGRSDHVGQLSAGPTVSDYALSDARLIEVSGSAALLSYRADYLRAPNDDADWETMYVTSLWCRRDDRWVNTFSQDTAASGQRPV